MPPALARVAVRIHGVPVLGQALRLLVESVGFPRQKAVSVVDNDSQKSARVFILQLQRVQLPRRTSTVRDRVLFRQKTFRDVDLHVVDAGGLANNHPEGSLGRGW